MAQNYAMGGGAAYSYVDSCDASLVTGGGGTPQSYVDSVVSSVVTVANSKDVIQSGAISTVSSAASLADTEALSASTRASSISLSASTGISNALASDVTASSAASLADTKAESASTRASSVSLSASTGISNALASDAANSSAASLADTKAESASTRASSVSLSASTGISNALASDATASSAASLADTKAESASTRASSVALSASTGVSTAIQNAGTASSAASLADTKAESASTRASSVQANVTGLTTSYGTTSSTVSSVVTAESAQSQPVPSALAIASLVSSACISKAAGSVASVIKSMVDNAGGGTSTRKLIFPASCFETRVAAGWAEFLQIQGTNLDYGQLGFDTAADEIVISPPFFMEDYNGGNITITIGWKATATSGTVMWNAAFCGITDDEPWDAALSNHAFATDTPGGTAEDMVITTLIVDPAELAANDATVMKIWRDVSEDNMAGDAKLLWVQLEYTEA